MVEVVVEVEVVVGGEVEVVVEVVVVVGGVVEVEVVVEVVVVVGGVVKNMKIPAHFPQALLDETKIAEQIVQEEERWVEKQFDVKLKINKRKLLNDPKNHKKRTYTEIGQDDFSESN